MTIEIVDFPMKNGGSFHCKLLVHQRVFNIAMGRSSTMLLRTVNHLFLWAIYTMAMLVITRG